MYRLDICAIPKTKKILFQIQDIQNFHREQHERSAGREPREYQTKRVVLSNDGVNESKSTNASLNVYAVQFMGCRAVYPVRISKTEQGQEKPPQSHLLQGVIDDFKEAGIEIVHISADAPKRSEIRFVMVHQSNLILYF